MNLFPIYPIFPIHLNFLALFGLTLLLGLVGGEIAKKSYFFPIISGYIAIGFLIGPGGFDIVNASALNTAHLFVEISISLIMFELGRQLDFRWLYHDAGLLLMSIAESAFTFIAIFAGLHLILGLPYLQSALGGTIAIASSPAVIMMVASDLSAEGPVTRRTLILTSLNNLFALIIFTLLLPLTQPDLLLTIKIEHSAYRLMGALFLGFFMFFVAQCLAWLIGKHKENQFVLFVGLVLLTASLSHIFNVSIMLALFTLGVAARNFDYKNKLMEVDFGWLARIFFILLFVVIGVHLSLHGLSFLFLPALMFIIIRGLAKAAGIFLFARESDLTKKQVIAISFALSPMAGVAISMSNILQDINPDFGHELLLIMTGVVTILNLFGPIATQMALIKTNEALST